MAISEFHAVDVYSTICISRLQLLDTEHALLNHILSTMEFPNLIWLRWNKCPSSSLPSSISMKNLRVLQVFGSFLITLWHGKSQVDELKVCVFIPHWFQTTGFATNLNCFVEENRPIIYDSWNVTREYFAGTFAVARVNNFGSPFKVFRVHREYEAPRTDMPQLKRG